MKGEVRLELTLDDDAVFKPGRRVILSVPERQVRIGKVSKQDTERVAEIEFFRRQHGRCVAKFREIDSISEAERYVGSEIRVAADQLPALDEGWVYSFQLKGCRVFTTGGDDIGTVTDVLQAGGTAILKVDRENKETLIPFAELYVKEIIPEQLKITVDLPEDLRDLNK